MKNLQVTFTAPLKVELLEVETPRPGPGQALVRTRFSMISTGTELTILRGIYPPGSNWARYGQFPWRAGYCNVGVVECVGEGVTRVKPGNRVASTAPHVSLFAWPEDGLLLVPQGVSDEDAGFATIAQIVMHGVRSAGLVLGENAVVCGLGLLGQLAVALARFAGAWPVIGADLQPFRREAALRSGATAVASPEEAPAAIGEHTGGRMADVVFEVTGNPEAIPQQIPWLRKQGRLIILSSPRGLTTMDFHDLVNARGTLILGAHNFVRPDVANDHYRWTRSHDSAFFLRLVEAGLLRVAWLLSERFPIEHAQEAYARLLDHPESTLAVALSWEDR